ncbi:hypothetical protein [Embleya hyalina]|uniref:Uncharacterized protein n=1 Tax=Embleya hyalina TaxID=516124 RepID=A0A401YCT9_9ACTN|nr:hypothetical protein [Embleya hyalina]GCD92408.1 hypothetical protein EHYA_00046 [Embleya hyalina]
MRTNSGLTRSARRTGYAVAAPAHVDLAELLPVPTGRHSRPVRHRLFVRPGAGDRAARPRPR